MTECRIFLLQTNIAEFFIILLTLHGNKYASFPLHMRQQVYDVSTLGCRIVIPIYISEVRSKILFIMYLNFLTLSTEWESEMLPKNKTWTL